MESSYLYGQPFNGVNMKLVKFLVLGLSFLSSAVLAGSVLIVPGKGGKFNGDLAKSYKSAGAGKVEFKLDTSKKIDTSSSLVNFASVKSSLEQQLGVKWSAKVTGSGDTAVVEYKGKEADFLKAVSQTKIQAGASEELAMEGSSSDGGIRAKGQPARDPKPDEVRGMVLKVDADSMVVVVDAKGTGAVASTVPMGKVKVSPVQAGFAAKSVIYFVPEKIEAKTIKVKSASAN